jgi:hypothetical protein
MFWFSLGLPAFSPIKLSRVSRFSQSLTLSLIEDIQQSALISSHLIDYSIVVLSGESECCLHRSRLFSSTVRWLKGHAEEKKDSCSTWQPTPPRSSPLFDLAEGAHEDSCVTGNRPPQFTPRLTHANLTRSDAWYALLLNRIAHRSDDVPAITA